MFGEVLVISTVIDIFQQQNVHALSVLFIYYPIIDLFKPHYMYCNLNNDR